MTSGRLKLVVEWGLIVLVALIPLHTIIVVSLGHFVGYESVWASWKEILLLVSGLITFARLWREPILVSRLKQPYVYLVGAFAAVALIVTAIMHPMPKTVLLGAKTDLEFLLASVIALVAASRQLVERLVKALLATTTLVVIFTLLQATVLPVDLLSHLGYRNAAGLPAPYQTVLIGNTLHYRFGSTLGGPNQLGTFLILPLCLTFLFGFKDRRWWLASLAILPALFVTYSRGAWIGAVVAVAMSLVSVTRGRARLASALVIVCAIIITAMLALSSNNLVYNYLHHTSTGKVTSDSQHAASLQAGLSELADHPLGHGLGFAGPSTFRDGGATNIIEDNYLQLGYETGWLGLLLFVGLVVLIAIRLVRQPSLTSVAAASALIGVSVTALVLPAWTDTATALSVWTVAGAALGSRYV